jgi:hypothetical protein
MQYSRDPERGRERPDEQAGIDPERRRDRGAAPERDAVPQHERHVRPGHDHD